MAGPFLTRDYELAAQLEVTWAVSPGALVAADFFKSRTKYPFGKVVSRYDRDRDRDNAQASVVETQKGRESGTFSVEGDIIPSGNGATPTEPDMDNFFEAHLGTKHKATANTTLTSGSTATVLNFTAGGGAASGVAVGDIIVVDVSATFGLEARQVITVATDVITVDRALSAAPLTGRNVYLGTTYRLSSTLLKSVHLWGYLNGDNFRHKMGGCIPRSLALECNFDQDNPVGTVTVSGEGEKVAAHTTARPTPVTVGQPLLPAQGKCWMGTALTYVANAGLTSDNGGMLRANDSSALYPTGAKRTGNNSRFKVEQSLSLLLTTGTVEGYYDNQSTLAAYDVLVQLGVTPGAIVCWRTPKYIPQVPTGEIGDEVALDLSGKCYATTALNDEFTLAFI